MTADVYPLKPACVTIGLPEKTSLSKRYAHTSAEHATLRINALESAVTVKMEERLIWKSVHVTVQRFMREPRVK